MPSTTTALSPADIRRIIRAVGPGNIGEAELDNLTARLDRGTVSQTAIDRLSQILCEDLPMHVAETQALNPDGNIADQAAYERMLASAGREQDR